MIENLLPQGRRAADRRRDGLHLPQGRRASRSARAGSRRTSSTLARKTARARPSGAARSSCCRSTTSCGTEPSDDGRGEEVAERDDPRGPDGARHRPADAATCTAQHIRDAKTVFWNGPMGLFEVPTFAAGTAAVAEAMANAQGRGHRRRRRRLASRRSQQAGLAEQDDPRLDRRRRVARVPRGPRAARRRGARAVARAGQSQSKEHRCARTTPFIAGNWKMHKTRGRGARAGARAARPGRDGPRPGRGRGRAAVHRAPPGGARRSRARTSRVAGAELPLGGEGRLHRRGRRRRCSRRPAARYVHRRPLRAAAVLRRDRRDGEHAGARGAARRAAADRLRRRDARRARGRPDARGRRAGSSRAALAGFDATESAPTWSSPTSRSGRSAPARPRRPSRRRRSTRTSASSSSGCSAATSADGVRIQYGGSVKPDNAAELLVAAGHRRRAGRRRVAQGRRLRRDRQGRPVGGRQGGAVSARAARVFQTPGKCASVNAVTLVSPGRPL